MTIITVDTGRRACHEKTGKIAKCGKKSGRMSKKCGFILSS
jgi:hypothetical protein